MLPALEVAGLEAASLGPRTQPGVEAMGLNHHEVPRWRTSSEFEGAILQATSLEPRTQLGIWHGYAPS